MLIFDMRVAFLLATDTEENYKKTGHKARLFIKRVTK
jgi:hypothetical protein